MEKERPIPRIYPEVSIGNWVITLGSHIMHWFYQSYPMGY